MKSVVFIITHGRAKKQRTLELLKKLKCTHRIYLVVDDMDDQLEEYIKKYGDDVLIFNKIEIAERTDTRINKYPLGTALFARNACFEFANQMNLDMYWVIDDDVTSFTKKTVKENKMKSDKIKNISRVFKAYEEYMENTKIHALSMCGEGAYIGGVNKDVLNGYKYSLVCCMLFSTKRPVIFESAVLEDNCTSYKDLMIGKIEFTPMIMAFSTPGDNAKGGNEETYGAYGGYASHMFEIIGRPDTLVMKNKKGKWLCDRNIDTFCPKILNEKWKKKVSDDA